MSINTCSIDGKVADPDYDYNVVKKYLEEVPPPKVTFDESPFYKIARAYHRLKQKVSEVCRNIYK